MNLNAEQLIAEKFSDFEQLRRGHLKIIANAPQPALRLIAEYSEQIPQDSIDFTLYDRTTATRMLRDRAADVAIIALRNGRQISSPSTLRGRVMSFT